MLGSKPSKLNQFLAFNFIDHRYKIAGSSICISNFIIALQCKSHVLKFERRLSGLALILQVIHLKSSCFISGLTPPWTELRYHVKLKCRRKTPNNMLFNKKQIDLVLYHVLEMSLVRDVTCSSASFFTCN